MAIGICDWGIGGLGFYNHLRSERADLDVVYIGDQGVPGYGLFDRQSLAARVTKIFEEFRRQGATDVVVACNAASTVVGDVNVPGVRGTGIIKPTLSALSQMNKGPVGVIGGRRTVRSGSYRRPMLEQGWDVRQRVAQPLSRRIEDGEAHTADTGRLLSQILAPLRGVDRIVLACTHYIVLEPAVLERLPGVEIVNPATEAWRQFRTQLPPIQDHVGTTRFLTTGSAEAMSRQAKTAFGVNAECEGIIL